MKSRTSCKARGFASGHRQSALGQIRQRFRRMRLRVRAGIGFDHGTVRADEDGDAGGPFLIGARRRAISQGHGPVRIAKQLCCETNLVTPGFQVIGRAEGYAQQYGILIGKFLGSITEPAGFLRSAVAEGARKEPD